MYSCIGHRQADRISYAPYYVVICDLAGCIIFFISSHKRHDFRKNYYSDKTCIICSFLIL